MDRPTLRMRICQHVLSAQSDFISSGDILRLKVLSEKDVAEALGLPPYKVSKAMTDLFVQLPSGDIVQLKSLTLDSQRWSAARIRYAIRKMAKNPDFCLNGKWHTTDEKLRQAIRSLYGIDASRRTISKHRLEFANS